MAQTASRIEFTGEVPGPGSEILVADDNQVVIEADETDKPTAVGSKVIARVAIDSYNTPDHREDGFRGVWVDLRQEGIPPIRVSLFAAPDRTLRITADPSEPDAAVNDKLVKTRHSHRFYLLPATNHEETRE